MDQRQIISNIKLILKEKRLTQKQFAKMLGVSTSHISGILSGRVRISLPLLLRITDVLDCKLKDLTENTKGKGVKV